jgi:glycosyltransferase involved in cell wall biosynthesis
MYNRGIPRKRNSGLDNAALDEGGFCGTPIPFVGIFHKTFPQSLVMGGVSVSHSGVHQAYQMALAAHEMASLDCFYCSLFVGDGKWGGWAQRWFGSDRLINRRCAGILPELVKEYPWPLLRHHIKSRLFPSKTKDWFVEADAFDGWVAKKLRSSSSRVFCGTETCTEKSFATAGERGIIRVLDCPQWHPASLKRVLDEGARRIGLREPKPLDTPAMARRKGREFESAEWLLVYSDAHRLSFEQAGIPAAQIFQCPLWVDQTLWHPEPRPGSVTKTLRVIFAGSVNLRKGVFFLLEAIKQCTKTVELTLAGPINEEGHSILRKTRVPYRAVGVQTKTALRRLYATHDILVLPSLADSFGFVALEAMACGLPVIVTQNCGVPVPDPSWRVPVMDCETIARRLEHYAENREALERDGLLAQQFARQFTPDRYRDQIKNLFRRILGDMSQPVAVGIVKS